MIRFIFPIDQTVVSDNELPIIGELGQDLAHLRPFRKAHRCRSRYSFHGSPGIFPRIAGNILGISREGPQWPEATSLFEPFLAPPDNLFVADDLSASNGFLRTLDLGFQVPFVHKLFRIKGIGKVVRRSVRTSCLCMVNSAKHNFLPFTSVGYSTPETKKQEVRRGRLA